MRNDALGFFWRDEQKIKKKDLAPERREAPVDTWSNNSDYLPDLEAARAFNVELYNQETLYQAYINRETLVFDVESYPNYFLVSFRSVQTGRVIFFEDVGFVPIDKALLRWVMENFLIVGFNSNFYDMPICTLALNGYECQGLKQATDMLITENMRSYDLLKLYNLAEPNCNHVDLFNVAPLRANLKVYAGRIHTIKMQDLPFPPDTLLTPDQMLCVRWYNINADLVATAALYNALWDQIELRKQLRATLILKSGSDLRSKSDAQIAEVIIGGEIRRRTKQRVSKRVIPPGTPYEYNIPDFLQYDSPLMQSVLDRIRHTEFEVGIGGSISMPDNLAKFEIEIAKGVYRMGLGGLHSSEKNVSYHSDDDYVLIDKDVASYYPSIILRLGLYPEHIGPVFLHIYSDIVDRRLRAKAADRKIEADTLKITVNGSFGKFGSKYSILYSPSLLMQVTITGQLALLMLIERVELAGIEVVSANTDGLVIRCHRSRVNDLDNIAKQWMQETSFTLESTTYKSLYSRDVNNYIAIKEDGSIKSKGAYVNPADAFAALWKNPANLVVVDAVEAYLLHGTPVAQTILACNNFTRFITVRTVRGGAVKVEKGMPSEYLGKSIRWYYALDQQGEIVYAKSGNKVPRSDGAKAVMNLPRHFPTDVDIEWYIAEAEKVLIEINAKEVADAPDS